MLHLEYSRNPNNWSNTIAGDSQLSVHTPPKFLVPLFVGKSRKPESKGGKTIKKKKKESHGFVNAWDCSQRIAFRGTRHRVQGDFKGEVLTMLLSTDVRTAEPCYPSGNYPTDSLKFIGEVK